MNSRSIGHREGRLHRKGWAERHMRASFFLFSRTLKPLSIAFHVTNTHAATHATDRDARVYSECEFTRAHTCTCTRVTHSRHGIEGFSRVHLAVSNDNVRAVNIAIFDRRYESIERNYDFICSSAIVMAREKRYNISNSHPFASCRASMTVARFLKGFKMEIPR